MYIIIISQDYPNISFHKSNYVFISRILQKAVKLFKISDASGAIKSEQIENVPLTQKSLTPGVSNEQINLIK